MLSGRFDTTARSAGEGMEEGLGEGAGSEMRSGTVGHPIPLLLASELRWMATSASGSDLRGSLSTWEV